MAKKGKRELIKLESTLGTGYFYEIAKVVSSGNLSTTALAGSTEADQFHGREAKPATDPMPSNPAL